jgi:hypothetical protein
VPKSFPVRRYWERNRTLSMVRNLESRNLWRVGFNVARVASESAHRPRSFLRYAADVTGGLRRAVERRRPIQAGRSVGDDRIFALRPPADLRERFALPPRR